MFNWGLAETLLSLGVTPVALSETDGYRKWVIEPALPEEVAEAGLRIEPNFELLAALRPDLMLITPELQPLQPMLEQIGRTETLAVYKPNGDVWKNARETAVVMGRLAGRERQAAALLERADGVMAAARSQLGDAKMRPVYLVNFIDGRHVRIYGASSIFQTVLERLGLTNAFTGWTNFWGFTTLGIEHLTAEPEAQLIYLEPVPGAAQKTMAESPLWAALPFVREQRITALPPVWSFGGIASAERLARLLGEKFGAGTAETAGNRDEAPS